MMIFLHVIDLAILNSFIMFTALQKQYPQDERLQRKGQYAQKDFRCELIQKLGLGLGLGLVLLGLGLGLGL